jgi:CheY-like chemotaxis protein
MKDGTMRILLVEDNPGDASLLREVLAESGAGKFELTWEERLGAAIDRVTAQSFDVVLLDLGLPDGHGLETLASMHARARTVPIVILSGMSDETLMVRAVRQGAQDYLVKGQIEGPLLVRSLQYAIERKRAEVERERLIRELREALAKAKLLSGILPICASCKRIRDDKGCWNQIETYISANSEADFSHSICPECAQAAYDAFTPASESGETLE